MEPRLQEKFGKLDFLLRCYSKLKITKDSGLIEDIKKTEAELGNLFSTKEVLGIYAYTVRQHIQLERRCAELQKRLDEAIPKEASLTNVIYDALEGVRKAEAESNYSIPEDMFKAIVKYITDGIKSTWENGLGNLEQMRNLASRLEELLSRIMTQREYEAVAPVVDQRLKKYSGYSIVNVPGQ